MKPCKILPHWWRREHTILSKMKNRISSDTFALAGRWLIRRFDWTRECRWCGKIEVSVERLDCSLAWVSPERAEQLAKDTP